MENTIIEILRNFTSKKPEDIKMEDLLDTDLEMDSLSRFGLLSDIEYAFNIEVPDRKLMTIQTVQDVVDTVKELTENN